MSGRLARFFKLRDIIAPLSKRYAAGLDSYGKKVKSEKRKERIIAELQQIVPGEYKRIVVLPEDKIVFKGYDILWNQPTKRGVVGIKPRYRYRLTKHICQYGGYVFIDYK